MNNEIKRKIKVDYLSGVQVDYAMTLAMDFYQGKVVVGSNVYNDVFIFSMDCPNHKIYKPTKDWDHTGQLIERYDILIEPHEAGFKSSINSNRKIILESSKSGKCETTGKTKLEAACKSLIKHALGDFVYICESLCKILGFDDSK